MGRDRPSALVAVAHRLALAASSSGATDDLVGGLFVMERRTGTWQVVDRARSWLS